MNKLSVILALGIVGTYASAQRTELLAPLTGVSVGKAKWKTRDTATEKQAELQVEAGPLQRNKAYRVTIAGRSWVANTDAIGKFRLTQRFIGPVRPNITVGTIVIMRNVATNAIVLRGVFH